ncbi:MAG: sensor histidine kinase [Lachnospiraceae bacterium]
MESKNRLLNWTLIIYVAAVVVSAILLVYIGVSENVRVVNKRESDGYVRIGNYEYTEIEDADAPLGIRRGFVWKLNEVTQGDTSLVFYIVHTYANVYLDGEQVYSIGPGEEQRIGKTIGSNWVAVPLQTSDSGKEVRVELVPVYESVRNRQVDLLIGSVAQIYRERLQADLPQLIVSLIAWIVGVAFLGIAVSDCIRARKGKKAFDASFVFLGLFSLTLGIWKLSDTRFSPLLMPQNPILLSYISLIMLALAGVPLIMTVQTQFQQKRYRFLDIICMVSIISYMFVLGMQIVNVTDLRENLWVTHVWMVVYAAALIASVTHWCITHKKEKHSRLPEGLFVLCAIGGVADVISFYIKGNSSGIIFTLSAFLLYVILTGVIRIIGYMEQERKLKEQEAELASNRISIMLSQIQPHFLYNSLNSIYHLCAKDPDKAREAISNFSDYLRANLDSLTYAAAVPFERELQHVRIYLSLEKMRFDEGLNIQYEIETTDFLIPALTVQPLVENAVKHGIGKKPEGGTVKIATQECRDYFEVTISDDGVGYDENAVTDGQRCHVGIENVRNRLWQMCRATLEIKGEKDKGTVAKIRVPKEKM